MQKPIIHYCTKILLQTFLLKKKLLLVTQPPPLTQRRDTLFFKSVLYQNVTCGNSNAVPSQLKH